MIKVICKNIGGLSHLVIFINLYQIPLQTPTPCKIPAEAPRFVVWLLLTESETELRSPRSSRWNHCESRKGLTDVSENANRSGFRNIRDIPNLNLKPGSSIATNIGMGNATGYQDLDHMNCCTRGVGIILKPFDLWLVNCFALNIAQNIGTKLDKTVAIFSLGRVWPCMLRLKGLVESHSSVQDNWLEEEWRKYTIAQGIKVKGIYIDDTPGTELQRFDHALKNCLRKQQSWIDFDRLPAKHQGLVVRDRQQEVSEITGQLKILAKELKVPVIALSQLSRSVGNVDKDRCYWHLRESGLMSRMRISQPFIEMTIMNGKQEEKAWITR